MPQKPYSFQQGPTLADAAWWGGAGGASRLLSGLYPLFRGRITPTALARESVRRGVRWTGPIISGILARLTGSGIPIMRGETAVDFPIRWLRFQLLGSRLRSLGGLRAALRGGKLAGPLLAASWLSTPVYLGRLGSQLGLEGTASYFASRVAQLSRHPFGWYGWIARLNPAEGLATLMGIPHYLLLKRQQQGAAQAEGALRDMLNRTLRLIRQGRLTPEKAYPHISKLVEHIKAVRSTRPRIWE